MSSATLATEVLGPVPRAASLYAPYRFSVEQYDRMVDLGILTPKDQAELIEGWIVRKMPQKPPHARAITRLNKRLLPLLGEAWELRVQAPIALRLSRPEPDFAIVRGPDERYAERHPRPGDIGLLIEVADATLLSDRQSKLPLYAAAKIVECWLVNLVEGLVEVYTQPKGGKAPTYRQRRDYRLGEQVPVVLLGQEIARLSVADLCLLKA